MLTRMLIAVLLLLAGLAAQSPQQRIEELGEPLSVVICDDAIFAVHATGVSLSSLDDDGRLIGSVATRGARHAQGTGDPVPTLTTSWCDKDGVTHTVSTPIVSTTEAGLARATTLHNRLVAIQQAQHPPKPCTPPPTPQP